LQQVDLAAERIKGKEIILFLGETGAGKSTTIHFLAGSKMGIGKIKGEDGDVYHIGPTAINNP
jgi:ABC-type multidrug transport system ATPase subunit